MKTGLCIQDLSLKIENKVVLEKFSLEVPAGEMHALMGPNGAGKSSLAKAIAGHPDYRVSQGEIIFNDTLLLGQKPEAIAKLGIFLAFQYPAEIEGLSVANFIRAALQAHQTPGENFSVAEFYAKLYRYMDQLQMDRSFSARSLNLGFSGGEKKRCEALQMLLLQPQFVILDETDSGLDSDALRVVAKSIDALREERYIGGLVITHYSRLLQYILPDRVHILLGGKIVRSGGMELVEQLDKTGYQSFSAL